MNEKAPEVVAACESFCDDVTFIPVSPQGCSPEPHGGLLGVRPENIKPIWAEVPLLYAIGRAKCTLIPAISRVGVRTVDAASAVSEDANQLRVFKETGT